MRTYILCAALLFLCVFPFKKVNAQNRIQKQAYELNDPRNPDCPCHKLQKQAEDEYAGLNKKMNGNEQVPVNVSAEGTEMRSFFSAHRMRRRKRFERINDLTFKLEHRKNKAKKRKRGQALCSRW